MIRLFESFKSQKELELLSNDILLYSSFKTFDECQENINFNKNDNEPIKKIEGLYLKEIKYNRSEWLNKYNEIKPFILEYKNLYIEYKEKINNTKGEFTYDKIYGANITLYHDEYLIGELNDKFNRYDDFSNNTIYISLHYSAYKTLLHELQHAYDRWRSNGKSFKELDSKYIKSYAKELELRKKINNGEVISKEESDFIDNNMKKYLNFKHEVDARFTVAIYNTSPYSLDWDDDIYTMKPWDEYYSKFKDNMHGWDDLSERDKKRLQRKLSQFYNFEKGRLPEENEKLKKELEEDD